MAVSRLNSDEFKRLKNFMDVGGAPWAQRRDVWDVISNLPPLLVNQKHQEKLVKRLAKNFPKNVTLNKNILGLILEYNREPSFVCPITKQPFRNPGIVHSAEYAKLVLDDAPPNMQVRRVMSFLSSYLAFERLFDGMLNPVERKSEAKSKEEYKVAWRDRSQVTLFVEPGDSKRFQESELNEQELFLNELSMRLQKDLLSAGNDLFNLFAELGLAVEEAKENKETVDLYAVRERVGPLLRMRREAPGEEENEPSFFALQAVMAPLLGSLFFIIYSVFRNCSPSGLLQSVCVLSSLVNTLKEMKNVHYYRSHQTLSLRAEILSSVMCVTVSLLKVLIVSVGARDGHDANVQEVFFKLMLPSYRLGYDGFCLHPAAEMIYREKFRKELLPIPVTDFSFASLLAMGGMLISEGLSLSALASGMTSNPVLSLAFYLEVISATLLIPRSLVSCSEMVRETKAFLREPRKLFHPSNDLEGFPVLQPRLPWEHRAPARRISPCLQIAGRFSQLTSVVLLFFVALDNRDYLLKNPVVGLATLCSMYQLFVRGFGANAIRLGASPKLFQPAPPAELKQVLVAGLYFNAP